MIEDPIGSTERHIADLEERLENFLDVAIQYMGDQSCLAAKAIMYNAIDFEKQKHGRKP